MGGGGTRHKKEHLWSKAEKKTKLRATHLLPHTHHRQEESLPHQIQNSATKPLVTAPCPARYTPQDCLRQIKSLRAESQGCIPSAPPTTSLPGSPGSNRNPFFPQEQGRAEEGPFVLRVAAPAFWRWLFGTVWPFFLGTLGYLKLEKEKKKLWSLWWTEEKQGGGGAEPVDRRHIKPDLQAPLRPALHPLSLSAVTHPHLCSTAGD